MVIGFFTITPERSEVVDPTIPYLFEHAAIVFRKSGARTDNQWTFFIQPFQNVVYAVVAGSMVVMLLLLLLLEKCHQSLTRRRTALSDRMTVFQWAAMNFEILLAGLVSRPVQQESQSRASRVLVMTWLLFCVILTSAYSSQLTSSLTAGQQDLPFTSLAELLDQDTYKFGVASGTWTSSLLKNSTVVDYRRFYKKVLEFAKEDPDVLSSDILVHKMKAIHEDYASLQGSSLLSSAWSIESCGRLTVLPEKLSTTSTGFYLQKGSPYTRIISKQIGLMVDSGLVTKWKRSSLPQNTSCWHEDDHSGRVIGLADTQTAFFMAAFGLGLALIVFGMEKLFHLNSCRSGSIVH
ncbi:hypothetical protein V1264_001845 [Littorina saxatilis]|uniref:Ionotropic glutamate receptor C-terminal domain-containing protein n=2 Tax=Littorina saxatilis TaxID=31220 RepID=A0AAN9C2R5_9CAEN